jgi:hypothetical protein
MQQLLLIAAFTNDKSIAEHDFRYADVVGCRE